jgi:hypothetical protein
MAGSFRSKILQRGRVWRFGCVGAIGLAVVTAGATPVGACYGSECVGKRSRRERMTRKRRQGPSLNGGAYDIWATVLEGAYAVGYTFGRLVTGSP